MTYALHVLLFFVSAADHEADKALQQLGNPRYRIREQAHRTLARLGVLARPALERCTPKDLETARRVQLLCEPWEAERIEALALTLKPTIWPRIPWLPDAPKFNAYVASGRAQAGTTGAPAWLEYRLGTLAWIRSQCWQRRPVAEIVADLDMMSYEEMGWILRNRSNYAPPLVLPPSSIIKKMQQRAATSVP